MNSLFLLIPLSILVIALVIILFLWAVRSGQFDDLEGPAHDILDDDNIDNNMDNTVANSEKKT